jgi:tetratricopeptide (TPR) repeat protein
MGDRPDEAAALFAARVLADPTDWPSRANHAVALYNAQRWVEAAEAFSKLVGEIGADDLRALPMMFSTGYCLLQLDDAWGSLMATTAFLDYSNEKHPFYADALENTACAWEKLGATAEAKTLRRAMELRANSDKADAYRAVAKSLWTRKQVISTTYRILGFDAKPKPSRRASWPVDR